MYRNRFCVFAGSMLMLFCLGGCQGEDLSGKKTLFDDDHDLPDHWPADLADLQTKIDVRSKTLSAEEAGQATENAWSELRDLVDWAPEIAADSDLSESEWLPIHERSESLRGKLAGGVWNADLRQQIQQFVELLRRSEQSIAAANRVDTSTFSQGTVR